MVAFLKRLGRKLWAWFDRFSQDPRKLLILDLSLAACIAGLAVIFGLSSSQTHQALCSFRANLQDTQDRAKASLTTFRIYVHGHPHAFGLDPAILAASIRERQKQIDARQKNLDSLDDLNC